MADDICVTVVGKTPELIYMDLALNTRLQMQMAVINDRPLNAPVLIDTTDKQRRSVVDIIYVMMF